ncbi:hypothetical protein ACIBEK_13075 [Nocardia fusca]|jgi:hypothetical protein|uniref:hypothetical protein n=1 Tax=Nocardia fusca TaxID=941183 RepID=UPI0037BA30C5
MIWDLALVLLGLSLLGLNIFLWWPLRADRSTGTDQHVHDGRAGVAEDGRSPRTAIRRRDTSPTEEKQWHTDRS